MRKKMWIFVAMLSMATAPAFCADDDFDSMLIGLFKGNANA